MQIPIKRGSFKYVIILQDVFINKKTYTVYIFFLLV